MKGKDENLVFYYSGTFYTEILEKVIYKYGKDKYFIFTDGESTSCVIKVWIREK